MTKVKKAIVLSIKNIIAALISIIMLTPIALILINSFKSEGEATSMNFSLPEEFIWENYLIAIQEGDLIRSFFNSLLYASVSVFVIIIFSSMTAFVFSRNKTKLNKALYIYIVMGLTLTINHIALINIMQTIGLMGTRTGIIVLYIALQLPFAIFLMYSFISSIPREVDEAAVVDGCGPLRLFFLIVFPNLKPALMSIGVLNFLNIWNEFVLPLYYLSESSKWPMTNSIYTFYGQYSASWNLVSADIILTSLPVIIIYLLAQKYIVDGMTVGAVKG